jgi:broad specificity phosphatase PhoE
MRTGRLLLMRHGESEGNRARQYTPHPEIPLTDLGREQAARTATLLARRYSPRAIVSSPFLRARQTARIMGEALRMPFSIEADLRERNYGALTGRPYETLRTGYDPTAYWTWRPEGGESLLEVVERAGAVLDRVARAPGVDEAVVVSHGAVMLALWRHVTGTWAEPRVVPNAAVIEVEHRAGSYVAARHVGDDAGERWTWRR